MNEKPFIGNECQGANAKHGAACVEEIHLRGWNVHCECECHKADATLHDILAEGVEAEVFPHGCADRDTFNTLFNPGHSDFSGIY